MQRRKYRKIISLLVSLALVLGCLGSFVLPVAAEVQVELVGFITGNKTDLRASELLEARVSGYDGNVMQLTYKWYNNLGSIRSGWFGMKSYYGTYLYVYSSHNMYTVQNTVAEQEVYNSDFRVSATDLMLEDGRSHDKVFTGVGYPYAAVYGADLNAYDISTGSIAVEVYDGETLLGSATYGEEQGGFGEPALQTDLDNAVFGVFVGDSVNVKDLLGESAILHINCTASSVTEAQITEGAEYIAISGETPNYIVTGVKRGVAKIRIKVEKENCKFHQYLEASSGPSVHVFEKPEVSPDLRSLTLTNLDPDCTYHLGGEEGTPDANGTIVFSGLEPATSYEIEVRGHFMDGEEAKVVYTFVEGTTLTPQAASVVVHLDDTPVTLDAVGIEGLVLQKADETDAPIGQPVPLQLESAGEHPNYTAMVANGTYHIHSTAGEHLGYNQELTVNNAPGGSTLKFYTVTYDPAGGSFADGQKVQIVEKQHSVTALTESPRRPGYYFIGWDYNGTTYAPGTVVTTEIAAPMTLTAQWVDAVDMYINVHLLHDGNPDTEKHNVTFTLDRRAKGATGEFTEMFDRTILWDGIPESFVEPDYRASFDAERDITTYTAITPTYTDLSPYDEFLIGGLKVNYNYVLENCTQTVNENGDIIAELFLSFDPNNWTMEFSVELDEQTKSLPDSMKPIAANVRVTAWYDKAEDGIEGNSWLSAARLANASIRVNIDENGRGTASYPAVYSLEETDGRPLYHRIEVVSLVKEDGTVGMMHKDENNPDVVYIGESGHSYATIVMGEEAQNPEPDATALTGAYYLDENKNGVADGRQAGTVTAVISIDKPTLTLHNGLWYEEAKVLAVLPDVLTVPDISGYIPEREGYVFDGWYTYDDEEIAEGVNIIKDTTAYISWVAERKIEGTVTIDYSYENDGVHTQINDVDKVRYVDVLVRRRFGETGNFVTAATQRVYFDITESESATASFAFAGLPATTSVGEHGEGVNPEDYTYEYIVEVRQVNYDETYSPAYTYTAYDSLGNETERDAAKPVFVDNLGTATVSLSFNPEQTELPFVVDTTLIADPAVRPTAVRVVYEYTTPDAGNNSWAPNSQHDGDNPPLSATFTDGTAEGSDMVWNRTPDGQYEYLYRLKVVSYTMPDGSEIAIDSAAHKLFDIVIGDPILLSGDNPVLTARFMPVAVGLRLDTNAPDGWLSAAGFTESGASTDTEGYVYSHRYYYGRGVAVLPKPMREGYVFDGWYTAPMAGSLVERVSTDNASPMTLYAQWHKGYTVNFIANTPYAAEGLFRAYSEYGVTTANAESFSLNQNAKIENAFYDLPALLSDAENRLVFKGWYLDPETEDTPFDWTAAYTSETNVYAHWVDVGRVQKEAADTKQTGTDTYNGYDLVGVQIRTAMMDSGNFNGTMGAGLRFIAVLSEQTHGAILEANRLNNTYLEYGFAVAKSATAEKYHAAAGTEDYTLECNAENVNGVDTRTTYKYVKNMVCSGVADHYVGTDYRLYTTVIHFNNIAPEALAEQQAVKMVARAYIRYYDANGLYRTNYNNYTGTALYEGCSASYADAAAALGL